MYLSLFLIYFFFSHFKRSNLLLIFPIFQSCSQFLSVYFFLLVLSYPIFSSRFEVSTLFFLFSAFLFISNFCLVFWILCLLINHVAKSFFRLFLLFSVLSILPFFPYFVFSCIPVTSVSYIHFYVSLSIM